MIRLFPYIMIVFFICKPLRASEDAFACIRELTAPSAYSGFNLNIPVTVEVRIKIGEGGAAQSVFPDTTITAIKSQLTTYFGEKTRYRDTCNGKTVTFTIHYLLVDPPLGFSVSEVRIAPPDQIFVYCHRILPALDGVRTGNPGEAKGTQGQAK